MKNSQFFNYLINYNKKNLFLRNSRRKNGVGKMNGTAISQREKTPANN